MDKNELDTIVSKFRYAQNSLSSYNDEHAIGMVNGLELAIAVLTNNEPYFKFCYSTMANLSDVLYGKFGGI